MCVYRQHLLREGGGHPEDLFMANVEQLPSVPGSPRHLGRYGWRWERCRASAFCPPAGGRQTHSVNPSKLTEVGTSPTLRSRHLGGPASHLSFTPRRLSRRKGILFAADPRSLGARLARVRRSCQKGPWPSAKTKSAGAPNC